MSYSRQLASPRRHSATTFEAKEPYREDGIRLYARYDDHSTHGDSTVFAPTKRKKIEVEEDRYRSIAPGPPMNNQGWRVPKLPPNIVSKQQREREALHSEHHFMTHTPKRKPVVLPIDSSKRGHFEERTQLPSTHSEVNSRHEAIDFETYKREIERLKTERRSQNTTLFHDGPEPMQSPPLPVSLPPSVIPPVRIHEEIFPQRIEHSETITREPVQYTAKSVTEFPIFEPQIATYTPPMPPSPPLRRTFDSPPPRDMRVEQEAMRQFSDKLEVLRNSKRFRHLEDSSQEFTFAPTPAPRPQRTIEQIETIEIETEEYRRVLPRNDQREKSPELHPVTETITRTTETVTKPRIPSPQPPPLSPLPTEEVFAPLPTPPRSATPHMTSIDEHKRHIRVEVTEEILTERIERHRNRRVGEVQSAEKEIQVGHSAPDVIETATETIFLPSVDTSTQFEQISHTVNSFTQHDTPQFVDTATGTLTPEIVLTPPPSPSPVEVVTTESWTQMEERRFTDVSTQEVAPVTSVVDSSTQSEQEKPPPVVEKVEKATEIDVDQVLRESTSRNTTIEEIIKIDVHKQIPLRKEKSEDDSESHFEEKIEEVSHFSILQLACGFLAYNNKKIASRLDFTSELFNSSSRKMHHRF